MTAAKGAKRVDVQKGIEATRHQGIEAKSREEAARAELLRRVREALGRDGAEAGFTPGRGFPADDALARLVHPEGDLAAMFVSRARQAGMEVVSTNLAGLRTRVESLLLEAKAAKVLAALGDGWSGLQFGPAPDDPFDAEAGVTDVAVAVAETGTLVVSSAGGHRGACMIPPLHVALVPASRIVPDLIDACGAIGRIGGLPSAFTFITGPSKTADIEGILITGVHGPRRVVVVIVEDR